MLIVKFKETFRARATEWALALGSLAWGLLAAASPGVFEAREFYHPLLHIAPQMYWAIATIFLGAIRLIFLIVNGVWRPSAHIRAIGASLSSIVWGALFICALSLDWISTATAVYGTLLLLDILSLWFAAGDAKLADLLARDRKEIR